MRDRSHRILKWQAYPKGTGSFNLSILSQDFRLLDLWAVIILCVSLSIYMGITGCLNGKRGGLRPEERSERERIKLASRYFKDGLEFLQDKNDDRAINSFEKALTFDPNISSVYNNLGILYKRKGMLDKAIEEYLKAIEIDPDYYEAHNNLGIAYREKGDFKSAETEYRYAITIRPTFKDAYYNLGILYDLYLNEPRSALENYKEYLRLGGDKREVEIWIADIERLLERDNEMQ